MSKKNFNAIVIKIGSSSLTNPQGKLDLKNLKKIVVEAAQLVKEKKKVILVTSGAIVSGAEKLNLGKPKTVPQKQAAAAVGQARLMRQYEKAFETFDITVAQVLLTRDTANLNARHCLSTLLAEGVVPIVNENDTVAVDEIKIGDNDNLAALTAKLVGADLLVLLTDVDGFYLKNELVPKVAKITKEIEEAAGHPSTQHGTGGMITKIQAAKVCQAAGIYMAIINSRKEGLIKQVVETGSGGTIFLPACRPALPRGT